jgi:hypothetical protein
VLRGIRTCAVLSGPLPIRSRYNWGLRRLLGHLTAAFHQPLSAPSSVLRNSRHRTSSNAVPGLLSNRRRAWPIVFRRVPNRLEQGYPSFVSSPWITRSGTLIRPLSLTGDIQPQTRIAKTRCTSTPSHWPSALRLLPHRSTTASPCCAPTPSPPESVRRHSGPATTTPVRLNAIHDLDVESSPVSHLLSTRHRERPCKTPVSTCPTIPQLGGCSPRPHKWAPFPLRRKHTSSSHVRPRKVRPVLTRPVLYPVLTELLRLCLCR